MVSLGLSGRGWTDSLIPLCCSKLALAEYEEKTADEKPDTLNVDGLQPSHSADPITTEQNAIICPSCTSALIPNQTSASSSISTSDFSTNLSSTPSNILLGVQGLHRLFTEFQTSLVEKEGKIAQLEDEVAVRVLQVQTEREMVQKAVTEKEEIRRKLNAVNADDESASKVVERYM